MAALEIPYLIAPRELPDGTVLWEEQRPALAQRVRDGDPIYGWNGDERLSLHLNVDFYDERDGYRGPAWEVWRRHEDGTSSVVMRKKGARIDEAVLLRRLAEHDTRFIDVVARTAMEQAQLDRDRDREFEDKVEDSADRLAHALAKDLDLPAPDGKMYSLGSQS